MATTFIHRSIAGRIILVLGAVIAVPYTTAHVVFCVPDHPAFEHDWEDFGEPFVLSVRDDAIVYLNSSKGGVTDEPCLAKDATRVLLEMAAETGIGPGWNTGAYEVKVVATDILDPNYRTLLPANIEALAYYADDGRKVYASPWQ